MTENEQVSNEQISEEPQPVKEETSEQTDITQESEEVAANETESEQTDLTEKLQDLQDQLTEERNAKLRYAADMENLRRRNARDLKIAVDRAKSDVLIEFLPVIDHLEMAVEHAESSNANADALLEGVRMVLNQFNNLLKKFNITPIDAVGQKFDPNIHEAMAQAESDEYESGIVIKQWQKGYKLGDKLIRPARVVVSKGPGASNSEE